MVHFSKLKLYGFKSFVDKTELDIGPGLNGVVGPNGCGKSNLVEALRWVMGEKSAKNMRGGGMEDVIFAGTSKRPARNMAQATIIIDNQDGTAPAPFNTASEIEISRHIERDKGSQYRVNGKAVRARDVNLLFADTMTGANSPALVSQGRITEIIVAKPQDRRRILEESAGISGLHSRRHEAELRLRAADQNLVRLNDAMNDMRSRLTSLKRQARQAERYKELSSDIRKSDMAIAWSQWRDIHQKIRNERGVFASENDIVQSTLQQLKDLETTTANIEKTLPDLRKKDMESRAVLQNFKVSMDRLDEDEKAKAQGLKDAEIRQNQLNQDLDFTKSKYNDTITVIEQSNVEVERLNEAIDALPSLIATAEQTHMDQQKSIDEDQAKISGLQQEIAVAVDGHETVLKQQKDAQQRLDGITAKIQSLNLDLTNLNDGHDANETEIKTLPNIAEKENEIAALKTERETLTATIATHRQATIDAQSLHDGLVNDIRTIDAEYNALHDLVARHNDNNDDEFDLLLNHLNVKKGYEKAVSNVLGHWIGLAGIDNNARVYWQATSCKPSTPSGYDSLSNYLTAPQSLDTFFGSVGVCDTLPPSLPALDIGQTLVARNGGFIRWDGLVVHADALNEQTDMASLILEQKNRLAELETSKISKDQQLKKQTEKLNKTKDLEQDATCKLNDLNDAVSTLQSTLVSTQHAYDRFIDRQSNYSNQIEQKKSDLKIANDEQAELQKMVKSTTDQIANSNESAIDKKKETLSAFTAQLSNLKSKYDENKTRLVQLQYEKDDIERQQATLHLKIETATSDRDTYNQRIESIVERLDTIDLQIKDYKTTQGQDNADSKRELLLSKISEQQTIVDDIAVKLETVEAQYKATQNDLRATESMAAAAREKRALAQANVANAEQEMSRIQDYIKEKFELNPQSLEEQTLSLFENGLPDNTALNELREESLKRRDAIGPVNLRAAIESDETETQLATMEVEHNDLTKAIAQLRGGISKLNREARERLAIAFKRVDAHFQTLFSQLFTGGKAYLEMIESDDPLESGLEIYAQPPGKALQKLSLLSGGEQTLTATALIFAMFMTNPSPICVLDEIDAPLDDANVDRVCGLMEKIANDTQTRFIVITHHRMTMARMDRLYGVTMSERGVSQLVSVHMALQDELALDESA